uniref:Transglutaminase-like domain-containing protein n=1 Tax=Timema shepardi TaxID=629360 RepID=A0A7R9G3Q0_TIMSH|nr:unnamed protein product [Timema shepardi]
MATVLEVDGVRIYPLENAKRHHTERYELIHEAQNPSVILRRGQEFELLVKFRERGFDPSKDIVRLIFTFGANPSPVKGTRAVSSVTGRMDYSKDLQEWDVRLLKTDQVSVRLEVRSPPDSPVGEWNFEIETKSKVDRRSPASLYKFPSKFYLLFNPWAKDDHVYMEDKHLLDEYVVNDVGKIWVGPYGTSRGREWVFGQFDDCVLPACMVMLDRAAGAGTLKRGDPIAVTRAISRIVNSNDEDVSVAGVIHGRWDGEYKDGTAPAAWTGSVAILEEYLTTGKEVKYGQCWVFAGVVTTVCRALGIPSRVVSNLVSAHDANSSLTVDRYYDLNNEELDYDPTNWEGEDSIWNYHVWNDVWMARPDLPLGYGGWQAIDATPQETSLGFFQCGPASLEAIKCGAVGFSYDVPFLLASVNADLFRWKEDPESDRGYTKISSNKYHIGRVIFTKAPWLFDPNGDKDREDITNQYKAEEGSATERLALMNAVRGVERAKRFYELPSISREELEFELVDLDKVNIGESFNVVVNINNKSNSVKTVKAILSAASVYYTGIKAHLIKKASGDFQVQPKSKELLKLTVKPEDYLDKLVEYCNMKIYALATVTDTNETWGEEDDFQIIKPKLDIKVSESLPVNQPTVVKFSFTNPLKITLTKCQFKYEGPGVTKNKTIPYRDIRAGELVVLEHRFTPMRAGAQKLVATFSSTELLDITGAASIDVYDDTEE